jgi:hypothetical protein
VSEREGCEAGGLMSQDTAVDMDTTRGNEGVGRVEL